MSVTRRLLASSFFVFVVTACDLTANRFHDDAFFVASWMTAPLQENQDVPPPINIPTLRANLVLGFQKLSERYPNPESDSLVRRLQKKTLEALLIIQEIESLQQGRAGNAEWMIDLLGAAGEEISQQDKSFLFQDYSSRLGLLGKIIDDYDKQQKIDAGKAALALAEGDLRELVREFANTLRQDRPVNHSQAISGQYYSALDGFYTNDLIVLKTDEKIANGVVFIKLTNDQETVTNVHHVGVWEAGQTRYLPYRYLGSEVASSQTLSDVGSVSIEVFTPTKSFAGEITLSVDQKDRQFSSALEKVHMSGRFLPWEKGILWGHYDRGFAFSLNGFGRLRATGYEIRFYSSPNSGWVYYPEQGKSKYEYAGGALVGGKTYKTRSEVWSVDPDKVAVDVFLHQGGRTVRFEWAPTPSYMIGIESEQRNLVTKADFSPNGLIVSGVRADSPAARAGILAGDVIEEIDGHSIGSIADIQMLLKYSQGDEISVKYRRGTDVNGISLIPMPM